MPQLGKDYENEEMVILSNKDKSFACLISKKPIKKSKVDFIRKSVLKKLEELC